MKKASNPLTNVYVIGATDMFKATDAPFHWEKRWRSPSRPYHVKVYEPDAYTSKHMAKSDETKCLVRWVVNLSNGMKVSRDGVLRLRAPEHWDRVRPMVAKLRGEKREQAMAAALWDAITPEEREAMVASVDIASYVDGRSLREAQEDLYADLVESKSPLQHIDAKWSLRLRNEFARRAIGGPVGSPAWRNMTWPAYVGFTTLCSGGVPGPSIDDDPWTMRLTELSMNGRDIVPGWMMRGPLWEFVQSGHPSSVGEVLRALETRLGGPAEPGEIEPYPSYGDPRRAFQSAIRDARRGRLAPQDRDVARRLYHDERTGESGWLFLLHRAWEEFRSRTG